MNKLPIVILVSGRGSNMQAILERSARVELAVDIRAVISNKPDALGLENARAAGLHTEVVDHLDYNTRDEYDRALQSVIDRYQPAHWNGTNQILVSALRAVCSSFNREPSRLIPAARLPGSLTTPRASSWRGP